MTSLGPISITEPDSLIITVDNVSMVTCNGAGDGAIRVTVTGGVLPYNYQWNGPAGFTASSEDISSLTPGNYTLTVTDANGCTTNAGPVSITEPSAITIDKDTVMDISCNGADDGSISVTVSGGTLPYSYAWSGPSGYSSSAGDITGLSAGDYTLTVTDGNGCVSSLPAVTIEEPSVLVVSVDTAIDISCNSAGDGEIRITVTGGRQPYSYSWTGPSGFTAVTEDLSNLSPGDYNVTVTDSSGCTTVLGPVTLTEPSAITITGTVTDIACYGGSDGAVTILVGGGAGGYSYNWTTNDGGGLVTTNQNQSGLLAGSYTVEVTDADLCTATETFTVNEPAELIIDVTVTDASCPDQANGSAQVFVSGGTVPYTIIWSNGATGETVESLYAGTDTVRVIDFNGCLSEEVVEIGVVGIGCLEIPTVITPNGDGYNDVWRIRNIEMYPNASVQVFDRWGKVVYHSQGGYSQPWDGTYKGKLLPMDSYHYVIDLGDGSKPLLGNVTIIR
ncbi:MAG: hypothetical protein DRP86_08470 [Candidatus Neomarinimicrobiota bacterium]|nr:MAG: hypothetical protein DRP86_08470 [Candidatus Neomarinimicrobiota bacterium]